MLQVSLISVSVMSFQTLLCKQKQNILELGVNKTTKKGISTRETVKNILEM